MKHKQFEDLWKAFGRIHTATFARSLAFQCLCSDDFRLTGFAVWILLFERKKDEKRWNKNILMAWRNVYKVNVACFFNTNKPWVFRFFVESLQPILIDEWRHWSTWVYFMSFTLINVSMSLYLATQKSFTHSRWCWSNHKRPNNSFMIQK